MPEVTVRKGQGQRPRALRVCNLSNVGVRLGDSRTPRSWAALPSQAALPAPDPGRPLLFTVELAPAHFPPKLPRPCPPSVSEDVHSHLQGSGRHEPPPPPHSTNPCLPLDQAGALQDCRACGEQPQAPEHSLGDTGVACEPSSRMLHWALPRRAWVNQDSAHVLTGPRPPQALPRPGRP